MGGGFNPVGQRSGFGAGATRRAPAERQQIDDSEALADALDEIAQAWKAGDGKTLQSRFAADRKIGIYQHGKQIDQVSGAEVGRQVAEGAAALKTTSFKLGAPKDRSGGGAFVAGTHHFTDASQQRSVAYVSYALERIAGRWQVVEYGWSDKPVTAHTGAPAKEEAFGPGSGQGQ